MNGTAAAILLTDAVMALGSLKLSASVKATVLCCRMHGAYIQPAVTFVSSPA
jgi:hypothetical protein